MKHLAENFPEIAEKNLDLIGQYGRFDDLYCLFGTGLEEKTLDFIKGFFDVDLESDRPTLAGKWFASCNATSKETKRLGHKIRKHLGLSEKEYRKSLSVLREKIRVVERQMCAKEWSEITYEHVPSKAMTNYRKAFKKHDGERFAEFISDVKTGKKEIKSRTLYPYELVQKSMGGHDEVLNEQWKSLPRINVPDTNILVVVDTSGSMFSGQIPMPVTVSLSLGLYFGEQIKGPFNNHFVSFSQTPKLQKIQGSTLYEKIASLQKQNWGFNTDLQAVFNLILKLGPYRFILLALEEPLFRPLHVFVSAVRDVPLYLTRKFGVLWGFKCITSRQVIPRD